MSHSSLTDHPALTCWSEESEEGLEEDLDYPDYDSDLEEDFYDDYEDEEMDEDDFEDDEMLRQSPLSWAVQNNHAGVVRLLLSREDIQPDLPNSEGRTPLFLACNSGNEEVVGILLEQGVAIDLNRREPWHAFSPLTAAAFHSHEGVVKLLLTRNDIDPNIHSYDGLTALSIAASGGCEGVVKLLLGWGPVDLNSIDPLYERRALGHAACKGHKGVVELLLAREGTEPNHIDGNGQTALTISAERGYLDVVRALLDHEDTEPNHIDVNGQTALTIAAERGHFDVVRVLLDREDTDPSLRDVWGRSPLCYAICRTSTRPRLVIGQQHFLWLWGREMLRW